MCKECNCENNSFKNDDENLKGLEEVEDVPKQKRIENSLIALHNSLDTLYMLNIKISNIEDEEESFKVVRYESLEQLLNLLPQHLNEISKSINLQISQINEKLF